ncbi:MAG: CocE/NonD family hydrolase, partial [Actinomycetota bacterium]|nr:CocE/NonD family hydrolase [Actinomycetota bacterium]
MQWALAAGAGDDLVAMAVQVSASQFFDQTYAGGGMSLETAASWMAVMTAQESRLAPLAVNRAVRRLTAPMSELPLGDIDERATGAVVPWYREAFAHPERDDPYWTARDFSGRLSEITAPVSFVGGWYDIFLPWMLGDHAALAAAGRATRLTIGPWAHTSPGLAAAGHRGGIAWLRAHLLDDRRLVSEACVRIRVTGEPSGGGWRELPSWPPPRTGERPLWLGDAGRLLDIKPAAGRAGSDGYRYDPADPTPAVGGPILLSHDPVVDNRELEGRDDVLVYTGNTLAETVEAIGDVRVELFVSADGEFFDVFARVCDVDADGVSRNVCDALARVAPGRFERDGDGIWRVSFALWPLGHRFAAGHRIRLQISSGAHPRYARNPGTGEDPGTGTRMRAVAIEIHRGERQPS